MYLYYQVLKSWVEESNSMWFETHETLLISAHLDFFTLKYRVECLICSQCEQNPENKHIFKSL